MVIRDFVAGI